MEDSTTKDERINLRLKRESKLILERAASFESKTVSKFIISCALERAEKTIHIHESMRLTREDSLTFFNALAEPVQFNDELSAALEEHNQRIINK